MEKIEFDPADFAAYYKFSPAALALREVLRLKAVKGLDLPEPILDVGCGDGLFARLAYPGRQVWGIDINPDEVKRAQASASYKTLICGNVCHVALPGNFFESAIANCSLEHVPELPAALSNIRQSMKVGGKFVLIVPTPWWSRKLLGAELLSKLGVPAIANAYGDALDRVFNHVHLHDDDWWGDRLDEAGFEVVDTSYIVSRAAQGVFEMLLPTSAIGYFVKKLTGRWIAMPSLRNASADVVRTIVETLINRIDRGDDSSAGEYVIIAKAVEPAPQADSSDG